MKKCKSIFIFLMLIFSSFVSLFAYHPLITDDTGTQGKGKFQLELNSEYDSDKTYGTEKIWQTNAALLYGITETIDIIAGGSFLSWRNDSGKERGISDSALEMKWKFFTGGPASLGIKPGVSFPTGDEKKELGAGKISFTSFLLATIDLKPFAFHANLGYILNRNSGDDRLHLWHASAAAEYEIIPDVKLLCNIGIERNSDKEKRALKDQPSFLLAGAIYSLFQNFDIDVAVLYGLNREAADFGITAGIALRF